MSFREVLGNAIIELRASTSKLTSDLATAKQTVTNKLSGISASMKKAGLVMSAAITAPLVMFGKAAVTAAADAAEMESKLSVVFGDLSNSVRAWSDEFSAKVNRSSTVMRTFASDTGDMLKGLGLSAAEAKKLSIAMSELAVDTASFKNVTDEQAIRAFQRALVGEYESLKTLGVALRQSDIDQELLNQGIKEGVKGATDSQKAYATLAILQRRLADSVGDAERTAGSAQNQFRAFGAAIYDLKIMIGNQLLPLLIPFVKALTEVFRSFSQLNPTTQKFIVIAGLLAAALGPLALAIGAISIALSPVTAIIIAATAAAIGLYYAVKNWEELHGTVEGVGDGLRALTNPIAMIEVAFRRWDKIVDTVKKVFEAVNEYIGEKLPQILNTVFAPIDAVTNKFKEMWDKVVGHSYVPDMIDAIEDEFGRLQNVMVNPAQKAADEVSGIFKGMGSNVGSGLMSLFGSITSGGDIGSALSGFGTSLISPIFQKMVSGPLESGLNSMFSGLFGFADGGQPPVGRASIVGERGPELFVPNSAGTIVPNDQLGSGGGVNIVMNNNFAGVNSVNRQELMTAMNILRGQVVQDVQNTAKNGGNFGKTLRGARA